MYFRTSLFAVLACLIVQMKNDEINLKVEVFLTFSFVLSRQDLLTTKTIAGKASSVLLLSLHLLDKLVSIFRCMQICFVQNPLRSRWFMSIFWKKMLLYSLTGSSANYFTIHKPSIASINYACSKHFQSKETRREKFVMVSDSAKNRFAFFWGAFLCLAPFVLPLFFHENFVHRNWHKKATLNEYRKV